MMRLLRSNSEVGITCSLTCRTAQQLAILVSEWLSNQRLLWWSSGKIEAGRRFEKSGMHDSGLRQSPFLTARTLQHLLTLGLNLLAAQTPADNGMVVKPSVLVFSFQLHGVFAPINTVDLGLTRRILSQPVAYHTAVRIYNPFLSCHLMVIPYNQVLKYILIPTISWATYQTTLVVLLNTMPPSAKKRRTLNCLFLSHYPYPGHLRRGLIGAKAVDAPSTDRRVQ